MTGRSSIPLGEAEASLCAAVRGDREIWRRLTEPAAQARFLEAAALHRCRPLLAWRLRESGELSLWPRAVRTALADAERAEAALEILRRQELCRLLQACAGADVPVLLFKGAALAYSLYPEPWLRPREDTDLLVEGADASRAGDVLASLGYHAALMQSGELVTHQRLYVGSDASRLRHDFDLHWKIANPPPFAELLSPRELLHDAESSTIGNVEVRYPRRVHALLLACWHRASHHYDSNNLLWLYDLHLLSDGMTDARAAEVSALARQTGTAGICARGLRLASEYFGTRLPMALVPDLEAANNATSSLTSAYLEPDARRIDLLMADLRSLSTWRTRVRLVREHLFPPADYMLGCNPGSTRMTLPALYLWRIARGARSWFRPMTSAATPAATPENTSSSVPSPRPRA